MGGIWLSEHGYQYPSWIVTSYKYSYPKMDRRSFEPVRKKYFMVSDFADGARFQYQVGGERPEIDL